MLTPNDHVHLQARPPVVAWAAGSVGFLQVFGHAGQHSRHPHLRASLLRCTTLVNLLR